MKKYFEILIALLVAIGIAIIPANAHAMKQSDLGGKVFLVDVSGDKSYKLEDANAQNEMLLIMFNKKGTRYVENFVNTDGQGNITGFPHYPKENRKEYNSAIKSKKGYYKIDMDMPVKGNDYQIKGNKVKMDNTWGTIQQNGPDDYTITWDSNSGSELVARAARTGSVSVEDTPYTQHLTLANQQYKFKW